MTHKENNNCNCKCFKPQTVYIVYYNLYHEGEETLAVLSSKDLAELYVENKYWEEVDGRIKTHEDQLEYVEQLKARQLYFYEEHEMFYTPEQFIR